MSLHVNCLFYIVLNTGGVTVPMCLHAAVTESTVSGCKYRVAPAVGRYVLVSIRNLLCIRKENPIDRVAMSVVEYDVTKQPQ